MDERPVRIWVHPRLKIALGNLYKRLNDKSLEHTNYQIPAGLPITSEIAAIILEKILRDKGTLISVEKLKSITNFNIDILEKLRDPVVFMVSNNWSDISEVDKGYLNLELQKIKGIKKNEIKYY